MAKKSSILMNAPNFGLHGTSLENLESILASGRNFIYGHYFSVTEKDKALPEEDFMGRLRASIERALGYSKCCFNYTENGVLTFESPPCLLLAVDNSESGLAIRPPESGARTGHVYNFPTFGISHDFFKDMVNFHPIIISKRSIEGINQRLNKMSYGNSLGAAYYITRQLNNLALNKIARALSRYSGKGSEQKSC